MPETSTKTYQDLDHEIIQPGHCDHCRACVTFCAGEGFDAIQLEGEIFSFDEQKCTDCGMCYVSCHMLGSLADRLYETYGALEGSMGRYRRVTSASTTDQALKAVASDGGVVSAYIIYLLEQDLIDGAILSRASADWGHENVIATTPEEVKACAGSRFNPHGSLRDDAGRVYNLPLISFLRQHRWEAEMRLAAVGTACQVHTLRKMQAINVYPANMVKYVVGLFCFENITLSPAKVDLFEEISGVSIADIQKLNLKDHFMITLGSGETRHVNLEELISISNPSCRICSDYSNRLADLSVGGHGSPEGFTTAVLRSPTGAETFDGAVKAGYIAEYDQLFPGGADSAATQQRLADSIVDLCRRKDNLVIG